MPADARPDSGASRPLRSPVQLLLLTRPQAARSLNVSERLLFGLTKPRGPIPAIRLPGRGKPRAVRYDVRDLLRFIDSLKT
jgi:hypothetical protein